MTIPQTKPCEYCGQPFEWTNPKQKFCSKSHKGAASAKRFESRHPERAKELHRKAQAAQRARHREAWKEYEVLAKEKYAANRRVKYAENREEERAKRRQWFWDNHGISLEKGRDAYYKSREAAPWLVSLQSAKARCKKSGMEFSLTPDWAKARWTGRCEMTDIPFVMSKRPAPFVFSPSLDRKDPSKGYTPDNCRFILHAVNALKGAGTDEDVVEICKAIVSNFSIVGLKA